MIISQYPPKFIINIAVWLSASNFAYSKYGKDYEYVLDLNYVNLKIDFIYLFFFNYNQFSLYETLTFLPFFYTFTIINFPKSLIWLTCVPPHGQPSSN